MYDLGCYEGAFTDSSEADKLLDDLNVSGCDSDCMQNGSNWSVIYTFMASTYMLYAANAALGAFGSFWLWPRVISSCCNCLLSFVFLAAIITTAVYRFRTKGQLCALSE